MLQIPEGVNLSEIDSYVVKVKGQQIEIEKSSSYRDKAANFLGRHVYSDGWSYETSKVRDVINAEMQKAINQAARLAAYEKNPLDGRQISEDREEAQKISGQLQNLQYLQQWVEKRDDGTALTSQALYEEGLALETGTATIKRNVQKAQTKYTAAANLGHRGALMKAAEYQIYMQQAAGAGRQKSPIDCLELGEWVEEIYFEYVDRFQSLPQIKCSLKAVEYYVKAAEQGDIDALYQLACLYKNLKPAHISDSQMKKKVNARMRSYLVAAFPGSKKNTEHIAAYYYKQAYQRFKEAADQGSAYACYRLGYLNAQTTAGQTEDLKASIDWFKKAADLGSAGAQYQLGYLSEHGELEAASKTAGEYYKEAAAGGSKDAQYRLGCAYEKGGLGLEQNSSTALEFYKQAAGQGHIGALKRLCEWYKNSELTDEIAAIYQHAANRGVREGEAEKHRRKQVVEREIEFQKAESTRKENPLAAMEYYQLAADKGHPEASYEVAFLFSGVRKSS